MSYWSGERLIERIGRDNLIIPYAPELIDCASYVLRVGDEAFVTQDLEAMHGPLKQDLFSRLSDNQVNIKPGQFAFLLTHEHVIVPDDAIAFISIKAKYKFKGLINVSGFHVDPGYSGKLIFSVYNAGPTSIIVQRKEPLFLIFYADLDRSTSHKKQGGIADGRREITSDLIQNMAGQVFSPLLLERKMNRLETTQIELKNQQATLVEKASFVIRSARVVVGIVVAAVLLVYGSNMAQVFVGGWIKSAIKANDEYKVSK